LKFLIIDNYDSFVYNIAQYLGELGVDCNVIRNDKITINEIKQKKYDGIDVRNLMNILNNYKINLETNFLLIPIMFHSFFGSV